MEERSGSYERNYGLAAKGSSGIIKFTRYLNYLIRSRGPHSANRLGGWHRTLTKWHSLFSCCGARRSQGWRGSAAARHKGAAVADRRAVIAGSSTSARLSRYTQCTLCVLQNQGNEGKYICHQRRHQTFNS